MGNQKPQIKDRQTLQ